MAKQSLKIQALLHTIKTGKAFGFIKALSREFPNSEVYVVGGTVRDAFLGRQTKTMIL